MPTPEKSWDRPSAYAGQTVERRKELLIERFIALNGQLFWVNDRLCQEGICPICLYSEIAGCGPPLGHDCIEGHGA